MENLTNTRLFSHNSPTEQEKSIYGAICTNDYKVALEGIQNAIRNNISPIQFNNYIILSNSYTDLYQPIIQHLTSIAKTIKYRIYDILINPHTNTFCEEYLQKKLGINFRYKQVSGSNCNNVIISYQQKKLLEYENYFTVSKLNLSVNIQCGKNITIFNTNKKYDTYLTSLVFQQLFPTINYINNSDELQKYLRALNFCYQITGSI